MRLNFCPNLTLMYPQAPFLQRFDLAAAHGFSAVEFQFPYEYGLEAVSEALRRNNLSCQLFNLAAGDRAAGEFGTLSTPGRLDFFRASFEQALSWAHMFGCPRLNLVYGNAAPNVEPEVHQATAMANIQWALPQARDAGVVLMLEPLNRISMPGAILNTTAKTAEILRAVADPHLRLQYDVFHSGMAGEDPLVVIPQVFDLIEHMQLADVPDRHEPGTGSMDFRAVFALVERLGFTGWIGLEYVPLEPESHDPRDWIRRYG